MNKEILAQVCRKNFKKYNQYDLSGEYGIGYTTKGEEFYFDLEDYDKIKEICWSFDAHGYLQGRWNGKTIKLHKFLFDYKYYQVDHENRKPYDNRRSNLRPCTTAENNYNKGTRKRKTIQTGVIGVRWDNNRSKWVASIGYNYKTVYLGRFTDINDAIIARLKAEKEYFGDFAPQKYLFDKYSI